MRLMPFSMVADVTDTQGSSSIADTGIKFVDIVGKVANIALRVDQSVVQVAPILAPLVTPFFPAYPAVIAALTAADPILSKIAAAAPAVSAAIESGRPVIEAAQANGPAIVGHIKDALNVVFAHSPVTMSAPSDALVAAFGTKVLSGTSLQSVFEASFFQPQDLRFSRVDLTNR